MIAYRKAYQAVDEVFGDRSVSAEETAARLKAVQQKCEENLDALRADGVNVQRIMPAKPPDS